MSLFIILFFLLLVLSINYRSLFYKKPKLPPSPPGLPIVGNLLQLGHLPHRSLFAFSQKLSPFILIHLGQIPILVASSADAAYDILKTHDHTFASRPPSKVMEILGNGGRNVSFSPYDDYWRQAKKLCIVHLLSTKRVQSFRAVRMEEATLMVGRVEASQAVAVNLSEILYTYSNGVVSRAAAGKGSGDGSRAKKFRELMDDASKLVRGFEIDELFPSLRWIGIGKITGLDTKLRRMARRWDAFLSGVVKQHMEGAGEEGTIDEDFVDVLLSLRREEKENFYNENDIKAIAMDMVGAGTDTSYATLGWAMAELVRNPRVMKKVQDEVKKVTQTKAMVEEEDVEKMNYLNSVVKEVLRLHPPAPLLLMHESTKDTMLQGYEIPAKTRVIINAWAIGRDSKSWEAPEEFRPERFIVSPLDFKGHDFRFIPFGAGRRSCPGMHFALAVVELALANLVYHFDWELPDGMNAEDLDMTEAPGLTTPRKHALRLIAKRRQSM